MQCLFAICTPSCYHSLVHQQLAVHLFCAAASECAHTQEFPCSCNTEVPRAAFDDTTAAHQKIPTCCSFHLMRESTPRRTLSQAAGCRMQQQQEPGTGQQAAGSGRAQDHCMLGSLVHSRAPRPSCRQRSAQRAAFCCAVQLPTKHPVTRIRQCNPSSNSLFRLVNA